MPEQLLGVLWEMWFTFSVAKGGAVVKWSIAFFFYSLCYFPITVKLGEGWTSLNVLRWFSKDIQHSNMGHYSQDLEPVCRNCNHKTQMNLMIPDILQAMLTWEVFFSIILLLQNIALSTLSNVQIFFVTSKSYTISLPLLWYPPRNLAHGDMLGLRLEIEKIIHVK